MTVHIKINSRISMEDAPPDPTLGLHFIRIQPSRSCHGVDCWKGNPAPAPAEQLRTANSFPGRPDCRADTTRPLVQPQGFPGSAFGVDKPRRTAFHQFAFSGAGSIWYFPGSKPESVHHIQPPAGWSYPAWHWPHGYSGNLHQPFPPPAPESWHSLRCPESNPVKLPEDLHTPRICFTASNRCRLYRMAARVFPGGSSAGKTISYSRPGHQNSPPCPPAADKRIRSPDGVLPIFATAMAGSHGLRCRAGKNHIHKSSSCRFCPAPVTGRCPDNAHFPDSPQGCRQEKNGRATPVDGKDWSQHHIQHHLNGNQGHIRRTAP